MDSTSEKASEKYCCLVDLVCQGGPPKKQKLPGGYGYEIGMKGKKKSLLQGCGLTKIWSIQEAEAQGLSIDNLKEDMKREMKSEFAEKADPRTNAEIELDKMVHEHSVRGFLTVSVRRLLEDWKDSKLGKDCMKRAAALLQESYAGGGYVCGSLDFMSEVQQLVRRQRREPAQSKGELDFKLAAVNRACEIVFGCQFEGFKLLLEKRLKANAELHSKFSKTELEALKAVSPLYFSVDESFLLKRFCDDLSED